MSHRPLAIVSGLTIGDYLLWNWSLNGSHDVLALVSGLTLPPLAAALVWLIALTAVRLLGGVTRRPRRPPATPARPSVASSRPSPSAPNSSARDSRPSRKLAA